MTRRLPDFVVIGAAKSGTTSLAAYLGAHDGVFMSHPKELRFFSHHWEQGPQWYAERFESVPDESVAGEASPQYTQAPLIQNVPERMASVLPHARLIYLVRNPIDQMASFYRHLVHKGREDAMTFDRAVTGNPIYLATASYGFQISLYLAYFPPSQLLIVDSSDLLEKRMETLDEILEFLGVEGRIPEERLDVELNRGSDKDFLPAYLSIPRSVWRASRRFTGKVPRRWRHGVRRALAKPPPASAFELSSTTSNWLRAKLEGDIELLRTHAKGGLDQTVPVWLDAMKDETRVTQ